MGRDKGQGLTYAEAGVDIDAGDALVERIGHHMRRTFGPRVIPNPGGFAGCFRLDYNERLFQRNYRDPVLLACTDGVGTKVKLAAALDGLEGIGQDLVAMNVNDLVVQGAEPLFFLDYIGTHRLSPAAMERIVAGVAEACRACDCALLGGETAEMPDVYGEGDFDLVGFAVGVRELRRLMDKRRVRPGDVVLGLASDGVHANGFSLVRRIVDEAGLDLASPREALGGDSLGAALLRPTRLYAPAVTRLLRSYKRKQPVASMAHITGGGLADNLARALPDRADAVIDASAWQRPPVFDLLQRAGNVAEAEMFRVFNMGVGYGLIVRPYFADAVARRLRRAGERAFPIGEIVKGTGKVRFAE